MGPIRQVVLLHRDTLGGRLKTDAMLRKINKKNELEVHVFICNQERILGQSFFSTNISKCDHIPCAGKCGKKNMPRSERVDCEFWPGDPDTFCIDCWAKL